MSKKALGKGLDALIPQGVIESLDVDKVTHIPIDRIRANPHQPRKRFDEERIHSLAESIKTDGVLQPVVVRKTGDHYELIMGERRLQAARLAGVPSVPAIVRAVGGRGYACVSPSSRTSSARISTRSRSPKGTARSRTSSGSRSRNWPALVGKDRSSVANTLRLLGLPEEIRALIIDGKLSEGHARALLSLSTRAEQLAWAKRIVAKAARRPRGRGRAQRPQAGPRSTRQGEKEKPAHITLLENAFSQHLSTRVTDRRTPKGQGKDRDRVLQPR